jgi:hypothetical protein
MYEEDTGAYLVNNRRRRGAKAHSRSASREVFYLSDSDHDSKTSSSVEIMETAAVFSDSLYGDSLPSMRAQRAASQQAKKGVELEESFNERDTLLGGEKEGSIAAVVDEGEEDGTKSTGQYGSLGGRIAKRARKEKVMLLWKK